MIFALDAAINFTIMLIGVLVFASILAGSAGLAKEKIESFELEEKALMIADSMVKNYNNENTLLGACIIDSDKKRVLSNQLSFENLYKAKPQNFGEYFVTSITAKNKMGVKEIKLTESETQNCISVKRFVLIDGEKGILEVKTCKEG